MSELPELVYLDCSSNLLSSLDVGGNDVLKTIICSGNSLTSLNVSGCYSLVSLECRKNDLKTLDISNCPQLDILSCSSNSLTVLDVTSTPLIRNYILTTPRVDNGSQIAYGEYEKVGAGSGDRRVVSLYHVELDPETAPFSNDTGRNLDTGINADPFLITTIIVAYMLTGRFAKEKKNEWFDN